VSPADFKGRWLVIYFYPKDNTPGCTAEACGFSENLAELSRLEAAILGISPDSTRSHRNFIAKYKLGITLLSAPDHQVLEAFGAWQKKKMDSRQYWGVQRSTFLIDPESRIAWLWPKVKVKGHVEAVKKKLAQLQG